VDVGAVRTGDPRLRRADDGNEEGSSRKIRQGTTNDDDDSDWD
jgi:hypothetical protein